MSQLDYVYRLIEAGACSYPGGGLDYRAAEIAIAEAIRADIRTGVSAEAPEGTRDGGE